MNSPKCLTIPLPLCKYSVPLDHFEWHIQSFSTLEALDLALKSDMMNFDDEFLVNILLQSSDLSSLHRLYAVQILTVANQSFSNEETILQLVRTCLLLSRYHDVLELVSEFIPSHHEAILFKVEAFYRLGCWNDVLRLYRRNIESRLSSITLFQVARASLEVGDTELAGKLIGQLQELEYPRSHNIELLSLLYQFRTGQITAEVVNAFLLLSDQLTSQEAACFLRFMNQAELLLDKESVLEHLYPTLSRLWERLTKPVQLFGVKSVLKSYPIAAELNSIAIVLNGSSFYEIEAASDLARQLSLQDTGLEISIIALSRPSASLPASEYPLIVLEPLPVLGILEWFREQQYSVIIDMISASDPRWLLVVSQRVAKVQILWSGSTVNFLPDTAPYDGQIGDRWIAPSDPLAGTIPWLTLPGVKYIFKSFRCVPHHQSVVSDSLSPKRSLVVLGGPHQLLPGAAQLLKRCLDNSWFDSLTFLSDQWPSKESIQRWWKFWIKSDLPLSAIALDPFLLLNGQNTSYVAADLGSDTPTDCIFQCITLGVPIAAFITESASSRKSLSILSALGLDSLVRTVPEEWLAVVEVLATNSATYDEMSTSMTRSLPKSLLANDFDFATHILASIRLVSCNIGTF